MTVTREPDLRPWIPGDTDVLLDLWLRSVRATHAFLSEKDIQELLPLVRDYLASGNANEIWVLESGPGTVLGFLGMSGAKIEAMFLAPEYLRRGLGRRMVRHARALRGDLTVDVNEQNTGACRFYEACGFKVTGRSELDDGGRPFPLLHLRLETADAAG